MALCLVGSSGAAARGAPGPSLSPSPASQAPQDDGKKHQHTWVSKTRKVWVPPEYKNEVVGTDDKGKPIVQKKMIKPGYWKTEVYYQCSCGATRG